MKLGIAFCCVVVVALLVVSAAANHQDETAKNPWKSADDAAEIIAIYKHIMRTAPEHVLHMEFEDIDVHIDCDSEHDTDKLLQAPVLTWNAEDNALYTVMMVDPDAPLKLSPTMRSWNHWTVVNVKGSNSGKPLQGDTLYEYVPPTPPRGTGVHRYVTLIFKQPRELTEDHLKAEQHDEDKILKRHSFRRHRGGFNPTTWLEHREVEGGTEFELVSAHWFKVQFTADSWYAGKYAGRQQKARTEEDEIDARQEVLAKNMKAALKKRPHAQKRQPTNTAKPLKDEL